MDQYDRERYATTYRSLAEVFERARAIEPQEHHFSFVLGELTRRIFVGSAYLPPDELLEEAAHVLRSGDEAARQEMAKRLREHAKHLDELERH